VGGSILPIGISAMPRSLPPRPATLNFPEKLAFLKDDQVNLQMGI